MNKHASIPSIQIDAELVGLKHCYDVWCDAMREVYDVTPMSSEPKDQESVRAWKIGELIFSEVAFSKHSFRHDSIKARNSNYLSLQIYKSGSSKGVLGDQSWKMNSGDVHVFDFSQEYYATAESSIVAGVTIPHEAIGYDPNLHPQHMCFPSGSAVGNFLTSAVQSVLEQVQLLEKSEADVISESFCRLIRGVMVSQQPTGPKLGKLRLERRLEMRSYINRNLSNPDLDVDHLCQVFNLSRPSVYRDFADIGGVASFITQRRLERAYYQLLTMPSHQGRVKEVANSLGFHDLAHFSRRFRKQFGMPPKEISLLWVEGSSENAMHEPTREAYSCEQLRNWFRTM
ncbi:MAG: AraC family transcriptional regulator [Roseibium sp.]|uniref:AraC family transcriptional regulator n=1 Tax=Roseibium sp. TaxID=1936156 RepID=UPI0026317468|nr:AraC family transcriptional regulator [Roseibium sp.]MCV0428028.1 AraC family transcriptional regulator [Roseibium sp.]